MENNNGKGIFYGVIGVATLVVAIIGATFAFFSATATGADNQLAANSVQVAGTLTIDDTADFRTSMIPVEKSIMLESYNDHDCKGYSKAGGTQEYDLCSTYDFTISNSATVAQTVYFSLESVLNTYVDQGTQGNLMYCMYAKDAVTEGSELGTTCKKVPAQGSTDSQFYSDVIAAATNATTPGKKSYTIVLYINETTQDQTKFDSGKAFTGQLTATTAGGSGNVTGVLSVVTPEDDGE